jgi:hypothetical protein
MPSTEFRKRADLVGAFMVKAASLLAQGKR